ncbi:type II toxin-antitoxin system prevent-host-death family antitoxin [candidate division KSB1 bacterium]|nr:MAG: type II toxin-antitoxin system prevent-host-death family antitoxin [candidate division KSB1 bacterium]MBC6951242.1 type II toxin-antitoxin system prevent-host-death family antitoxin [candidate division KSB1 bacterium]MCE7943209.1 type II toxin-antitoxin system prevent-host-death family antitoxin [Chlorobi bacterium CHB1]MDL1877970.1 type II toxin-antitoxin system prevent-host-death family antitoxin [Cytophagia bacterium CHB2]
MPIQTSYTNARANLAKLCDEVTDNREVVIINRRGYEDVVLIAASELASIAETAHLLRSPKNAKRLLAALKRAQNRTIKPKKIEKLRREVGLGQ